MPHPKAFSLAWAGQVTFTGTLQGKLFKLIPLSLCSLAHLKKQNADFFFNVCVFTHIKASGFDSFKKNSNNQTQNAHHHFFFKERILNYILL